MAKLLQIDHITKQYGSQLAVDNLSFPIQQGEICGLIGENGAGKTTLLRILAGLNSASSGQIQAEKPYRIGALTESPALHPNLSAQDNLRYSALQLGLANAEQEIALVLKTVGLEKVNPHKKAKDFSLGMRQRLALALAILEKPDLLILDEPINGLDPAGIRDMRNILLDLRQQYHLTILISSHILSELEQVVDRYVILHKGRVLRQFSKAELEQELEEKICLSTSDQRASKQLLKEQGIPYQEEQDYLLLPKETQVMTLLSLLIQEKIDLKEIFNKKSSFESYYLQLIQEGENRHELPES